MNLLFLKNAVTDDEIWGFQQNPQSTKISNQKVKHLQRLEK
jgi:hypothetical protein